MKVTIYNRAIRYKDSPLNSKLDFFQNRYINMRAKNYVPSKYLIDNISLGNIRKEQLLIDYNSKKRKAIPSKSKASIVGADQILLTGMKNKIGTYANEGFSLMLFCKNKNIASAFEIGQNHFGDLNILEDLFMYSYGNLKRFTGRNRIKAFLVGGKIYRDISLQEQTYKLFNNRMIVDNLTNWLINYGIIIDTIDIGGNYAQQSLNLLNGAYTLNFLSDDIS